jgi:hypothetical protein
MYIALMFLRAYGAAELRVNMLKDNIEMDSKLIALITTRTENKMTNIYIFKITITSHGIWYKRMNFLTG